MAQLNGKRKRNGDGLTDTNDNDEESRNKVSNLTQEQNGAHPQEKQKKQRPHLYGKSLNQNGLLGGVYTEETYKSNMFKLQLDQLLEEVKLDTHKTEAGLNTLLRSLKTLIESIPEQHSISILEAEKKLRSSEILIPFPEPRPKLDPNYKLSYQKPANMNVIGDYSLKTIIQTANSNQLNFVVTMPNSMFQDKDYMNYRYFMKRAFYLSTLAAAIKKDKNISSILKLEFDFQDGNSLLPVLSMKIKDSNHELRDWKIQLRLAVPKDTFKSERILPNKICVRNSSEDNITSYQQPTTFYNSTLMHESLTTSYLKLQHGAIKSSDSFSDAIFLGQIWLSQRGFSDSIEKGGFGSFEWTTIMSLLLNGGGPKNAPKFSTGYSSYQFFKAMLQYIASVDLTKTPSVIQGDVNIQDIQMLKGSGLPCFFDGFRSHNILYKMSTWSYKSLQHEANISLQALGYNSADQFYPTFIVKVDQPLCKYDAVIEIPESQIPYEERYSSGISYSNRFQNLYKILSRSLNSRVNLIFISTPKRLAWNLNEKLTNKSNDKLTIGFNFNDGLINRTVDRGPSAENAKEAASFRKFWGEKAELRRFKDGSIIESVIWTLTSTSIFRQIVSYTLQKHFGSQINESINYIENSCQKWLHLKSKNQIESDRFQFAITQLRELETKIRELDDMPLHLRQLLPADSQLSYSSVRLPFTTSDRKLISPANVTIQFEGSARWPDHMEAIQKTKMAFLLRLAELLEQSDHSITCRIGLENADSPLQNQSFMDVVTKEGAIFRLRIHHDRELTLLERMLKDKSQTVLNKLVLAQALHKYKQDYICRPAHTIAIQTLATRFPSFCQSVRLVKAWFNSHRLSSHFEEPLIELFVAQVYTQPYPWSPPVSGVTGLLRTLLLLSHWDWRNEPWIANLGAEVMSEQEIANINTRFQAWRKIDPGLNRVTLFTCSNIDGDGATWTNNAQPSKVVAGRMTSLANLAVALVKTKSVSLDIDSIFMSTLSDYDFVIYIEKDIASHKSNVEQHKFKNLQLQNATDVESTGLDCVAEFVSDLTEAYGEAMVLFYNEDQGSAIGGLWKPFTKRQWKLKLGYSSVRVGTTDDMIDVNKDAILNEICRIGGDIVKKIGR